MPFLFLCLSCWIALFSIFSTSDLILASSTVEEREILWTDIFVLNASAPGTVAAPRYGYGDIVELTAPPLTAFLEATSSGHEPRTLRLAEASRHNFMFEVLLSGVADKDVDTYTVDFDFDYGSLITTDSMTPFVVGGNPQDHDLLFARGTHTLSISGSFNDGRDESWLGAEVSYTVLWIANKTIPSPSLLHETDAVYAYSLSRERWSSYETGLVEQVHGYFIFADAELAAGDRVFLHCGIDVSSGFGQGSAVCAGYSYAVSELDAEQTVLAIPRSAFYNSYGFNLDGEERPTPVPSIAPVGENHLTSDLPSLSPSDVPSKVPSDLPSRLPSDLPSRLPSDVPSRLPSDVPSRLPSDVPSRLPSDLQSRLPSDVPSMMPTASRVPS